MVDEEKLILMTKLASYENGEGKKYVPIANYFRSDYISAQLLKSIVAGTVAFMSIMGIVLFYNFETIMEEIYNIDFVGIAKRIGTLFATCMVIYVIITYILAVYRYSRARKSLKNYYANLKKVEKM
ncbi:MAG: hypothetical protein KBS96_04450 [Lachnospiraceae bacterium]|nr:hypothetical protein [Candidatus Colinaster scatohippi]